MYEHIKFKNAINMRKANYDKFPSTKLTGMLVQGWDIIISMLKEKMDARKVLAQLSYPLKISAALAS